MIAPETPKSNVPSEDEDMEIPVRSSILPQFLSPVKEQSLKGCLSQKSKLRKLRAV